LDYARRRFHDALMDLAGWLRGGSTGAWYSINVMHPHRVRNDNRQFNSRPLYDRDIPPHVAEVWRLLESAPREHQRVAMIAYLEPGPRTLTGRAEKFGIPSSTLCNRRNRLLDYLVAASMGEDAPRASVSR